MATIDVVRNACGKRRIIFVARIAMVFNFSIFKRSKNFQH